MIIASAVVFTPFAFGQDLKRTTWLERASIIYDQKFSNTITTSIIFETLNNNEIQIPDRFLERLSSYEEVRFITFTNMGECVMGVKPSEECILISFNLNLLKGDGGINAVQMNGKAIGDELISDINTIFNLDAKFHSIWIETRGANSVLTEFAGTDGIASAVYTMPKQETNIHFTNLSESLISQNIINGGGFYDAAEQIASIPDSTMTVLIMKQEDAPMFLFKVSYEYEDKSMNLSQIKPLETIGIDQLERTKYFQDLFVPLNSIFQVVIIPENPLKVNSVNTNVIQKLDNIDDISEKGWFFSSISQEKIDARFLFGTSKSASSNDLIINMGPLDMQNSESYDVGSIQTNQDGAIQYAILAVIVITAIGAAIFYLKGYKRNN